ncbi:MAG TPA: isoaspartyl peptidase/L-asparaginase family protein [Methylomirabilota bacterium]|jgi:beta-aspartyl-peptidase (threonine type)|nr:isoaspartyl peptidase/L-asparaginase family protein [Methylomirabilota bacterium]
MVPALIVHGGAGADPGDREEYRSALRAALIAGWSRLRAGASALDAVEAGVAAMEAHPRLNAGYGSALTEAGTVECDASIMGGDRLAAGAVGAVAGVPSPIALARRVLEDGRHVLLVGEGAAAFARERGVSLCDPAALVTERQRARLAERLQGRPAAGTPGGTVGAVAIDARGRIAAGTSTGGYPGKRVGRVGDSALIGCGTYADDRLGGVSTTGHGEAFIRTVLAKTAVEILKELDDPEMAAQVAMDILRDDGRGEGGLILMDWRGRLGFAHSTPFMPVGWCVVGTADPVLSF